MLPQVELANALSWSTQKLCKIESGKQAPTTEDLLDLVRVLGDCVLELLEQHARPQVERALRDAIARGADPEEMSVAHLMARSQDRKKPDLSGLFKPLHAKFRVILGAQVPRDQMVATRKEAESQAAKHHAENWLQEVVDKAKLRRDKLEGWRFLPTLLKNGLETLRKPAFEGYAPVAPSLKSVVRGPWMATTSTRLVVDPTSLRVTVLTQPAVVVFPLRLLVTPEPYYGPDGSQQDVDDTVSVRCFRAAGFLASSWAQRWMRDQGGLWFSPSEGPLRDLPVPARLWMYNDDAGGRLGELARDAWENRGAKGLSWQEEIDSIIDPLMTGVPLLNEPTRARGKTSRPR